MRFMSFLIILSLIFLMGCVATSRQKDYILSSADALEIVVPAQIEYINNQIPPILVDYAKTKIPPDTDEGKALGGYLDKQKRYDEIEKKAIIDSLNQLLSTARTAKKEESK